MAAYDIKFADPGGEYYYPLGAAGVGAAGGVWGYVSSSTAVTARNDAPAGRASSYGLQFLGSGVAGANLNGNYASVIFGGAYYLTPGIGFNNNGIIMFAWDLNGAATQCELRTDGSGFLYFTRNGTGLGAGNPTKSANALTVGAGWTYFEVAMTINGTTGSAEVRVNSVVWLTLTGINTKNTANAYTNQLRYQGGLLAGGAASQWKDMYCMADTGTGPNTTYLGDITVGVQYPTGVGPKTDWTSGAGPYSLTSVNTTGVYTGTGFPTANNALVGHTFVITGFVNGANNQTGICTASSSTSITIGGTTTVAETHAGTASFQNASEMVNDGINHTTNETWPDADITYIYSNTTNQISDFTPQAISLTGTIYAVIHTTYARKDDAGARQIAQYCNSSGSTELSSNISLGNSYVYLYDILQVDPHTSAQWTVAGFNAATFGVKEIT